MQKMEAFTSQEGMLTVQKYQAQVALREIHQGDKKKTSSCKRFNVVVICPEKWWNLSCWELLFLLLFKTWLDRVLDKPDFQEKAGPHHLKRFLPTQDTSIMCPCSWQGSWNQLIFKVRSNPSHPVILWFFYSLHIQLNKTYNLLVAGRGICFRIS